MQILHTTLWYIHSYFNRKIMGFPLQHLGQTDVTSRCVMLILSLQLRNTWHYLRSTESRLEGILWSGLNCLSMWGIRASTLAPGFGGPCSSSSPAESLPKGWRILGTQGVWQGGAHTLPHPRDNRQCSKDPEFHVQTAQTVVFWNWLLMVHKGPLLNLQKFCKLDVKHGHYLK